MPDRTATPDREANVEVAHAIPGRVRLRLGGPEWTPERMDALSADLDALRTRRGILDVELKRAARTVVIRYERGSLDQERVLALAETVGLVRRSVTPDAGAPDGSSGGMSDRTEELAALIGIPTSFDRRFAEGLALSIVSLLGARGVSVALGGGTTLPAYFVIWFALRRVTGLGRRP